MERSLALLPRARVPPALDRSRDAAQPSRDARFASARAVGGPRLARSLAATEQLAARVVEGGGELWWRGVRFPPDGVGCGDGAAGAAPQRWGRGCVKTDETNPGGQGRSLYRPRPTSCRASDARDASDLASGLDGQGEGRQALLGFAIP